MLHINRKKILLLNKIVIYEKGVQSLWRILKYDENKTENTIFLGASERLEKKKRFILFEQETIQLNNSQKD